MAVSGSFYSAKSVSVTNQLLIIRPGGSGARRSGMERQARSSDLYVQTRIYNGISIDNC